jgi:hypothetical protein
MARDSSLALRKAIITHLRADADVTALVPAERIYPPKTPADPVWPFIRYGVPTKLPERASCMDGSRILLTVHAFSQEPSEDEAVQIGAALAASLDGEDGKGLVLDLSGNYSARATITYTGGQTLQDPEVAGAWHEVVNFEAFISS